ncbi:hypothetical protein DSM100238_1569 [Bifidobacterium apri]|uniref:Uncharacterized protein n=3 Tax=Bifidobacterium apri TaxID=1769423 RepID=A0A6A2VGK0_9BIFI|nr:hypothetical protein DSM100238_1569 [Bifidobacterium apri]
MKKMASTIYIDYQQNYGKRAEMKKHTRLVKPILAMVTALSIALGVGACGSGTTAQTSGNATTSKGEISRVKMYDSVKAITDDSDLVIVGTVADQRVVQDIDDETDFTLSTVKVITTKKGDAGDETVVVRQTGSTKNQTAGAMMKTGSTYLLFLVHSGLSGDLASQYYVTGADAGIYLASATAKAKAQTGTATEQDISGETFNRVNSDSGDNLPATLTVDEVPAAS